MDNCIKAKTDNDMPLAIAPAGQKVILQNIIAEHNVKMRLFALRLYPGVEYKLANKSLNGPCILILKESRLALDWAIANRIRVK